MMKTSKKKKNIEIEDNTWRGEILALQRKHRFKGGAMSVDELEEFLEGIYE